MRKTKYIVVSRGKEDDYPLLVGIYNRFESAAKGCGDWHFQMLLDSGLTDDAEDAMDEGSEVVDELLKRADSPHPQDDIHFEAEHEGGGCIVYSIMFQNE